MKDLFRYIFCCPLLSVFVLDPILLLFVAWFDSVWLARVEPSGHSEVSAGYAPAYEKKDFFSYVVPFFEIHRMENDIHSIHKEGKRNVAYPPTEEAAGKETAPFLNWNGSCPKGRSLSSIQFFLEKVDR